MVTAGLTAGPGRAPRREAAHAGPLLAVCGLEPGGGATTLAYLIAAWAAGIPGPPVLACDAGSGQLGALAGAAATRSLGAAARAVAGGTWEDEPLFALAADGLRVLAGAQPEERGTEDGPLRDGVGLIAGDARRAHALTVVDCGTLERAAERLALRCATHVMWVIRATVGARARAHHALARRDALLPSLCLAREALAVRRSAEDGGEGVDELLAVAEARRAALLLFPEIPSIGGASDAALTVSAASLEALMAFVRR